ncbi:MAG: class I SAM-dependent methyltransferase [Deltaproteobacteria bacterium]|nr:class I SAM-dependent methyltransferase [Deltaproteobacteria bacterium]
MSAQLDTRNPRTGDGDEGIDARRLYTKKPRAYRRFVGLFGYPQGLRHYFRRCGLLRPGLRILDAGCGFGAVSLGLHDALVERGFAGCTIDGFDLTPAMLDLFRESIASRGIENIRLVQTNVLELETLPPEWRDYDLLVTSAMLEYLPKPRLAEALMGLRARLRPDGSLVLFITRDNWLMRPLIGWLWESNLYRREELARALDAAGFSYRFTRFPFPHWLLNLWGLVVEARPEQANVNKQA